jgi:hypothetical protein
MGFWSSIKKAVKAVVKTVKAVVKAVVEYVIVKPIKFLTSWIPVTKKMRIQVFILRSESDIPLLKNPSDLQQLQSAITYATDVFKIRFNIKVEQYGKPIIQTLPTPAPSTALDVTCDSGAFKNEVGEAGTYFENNLAGWNFIPISLTFPISIFIVRDIAGKVGCSLGALTDYITLSVEGTRPIMVNGANVSSTLAHELGHCCGLQHRDDTRNLMYRSRSSRGDHVTYWQKYVVRSSRHCTFY